MILTVSFLEAYFQVPKSRPLMYSWADGNLLIWSAWFLQYGFRDLKDSELCVLVWTKNSQDGTNYQLKIFHRQNECLLWVRLCRCVPCIFDRCFDLTSHTQLPKTLLGHQCIISFFFVDLKRSQVFMIDLMMFKFYWKVSHIKCHIKLL